MTRYLALFQLVFAIVLIPVSAIADADVWHTTPAYQGDCGEECYTPPTAWINTADGKYAFGISCDYTMILAGPAMMLPEPPFSAVEMLIDGRSLGNFLVHNGLNDTYISATNAAAQSPSRIQDAINSGSALRLRTAYSAPLDFTLSGSRAAIQTMSGLCRN
jgi:hypothetical protein